MPDSNPQPIVILSAGFGDGHNAAARGIQKAVGLLTNGELNPPIIDLFADGIPTLNALLRWGYVFLTTHFPKGWKMLYDHADRSGPPNLGLRMFSGLATRLTGHIDQYRPQVIVSTYPLYPHLLAKVLPGLPQPQHVFSVVTDSLEINSMWTNAPSDLFFVTDAGTQSQLRQMGVAEERVANVGFAVDPTYRDLPKVPGTPGRPRLLFFATSSKTRVEASLRSLLATQMPLERLTVVLGRHEKRLRPAVQRILQAMPSRSFTVEVLGWTDKVPQLLASHDLVLTKAGGATTHECFALGVPVVVTHAIPGQEEGNARLLESRGCGFRCADPKALGNFLTEIFADGRLAAASQAMEEAKNPHGAWTIAGEILRALGR